MRGPRDRVEAPLTRSRCFLCRRTFKDRARTEEHIFPKWLQRAFRLYNEGLVLLNRTSIPYRQLTVPCCEGCNKTLDRRLERPMRDAVTNGYAAMKRLDPEIIFLWLAKMYYAVLLKEHFLRSSRKDPRRGPILRARRINELNLLHTFLQVVLTPVSYDPYPPWSLFVLNVLKTDDVRLDFDFRDDFQRRFIAIRMGCVGLIAVLNDHGLTSDMMSEIRSVVGDNALHPVQFVEVAAQVAYNESRRVRGFSYAVAEQDGQIRVTVLPSLSNRPFHDEFSLERYARLLSMYQNVSLSDVMPAPDVVRTLLHQEDGTFRDIRLDELPVHPGEPLAPLRPLPRRMR